MTKKDYLITEISGRKQGEIRKEFKGKQEAKTGRKKLLNKGHMPVRNQELKNQEANECPG